MEIREHGVSVKNKPKRRSINFDDEALFEEQETFEEADNGKPEVLRKIEEINKEPTSKSETPPTASKSNKPLTANGSEKPLEKSAKEPNQSESTFNIVHLTKDDILKFKSTSKTSSESNIAKENIHKNHRSRLKKQFRENGIESLSEVQVLELLLYFSIPQRDTNPLAHRLLSEFSSVKDVLGADFDELTKVSGVKDNTALLLKLVHSLMSYTRRPNEENFIGSTQEAKQYCEKLFIGADVEKFYVICLSKSNAIKKVKLIGTGTLDEITIQIRNITEFALLSKCNRIIICHNHPGGKGRVSDQDIVFTYSLLCSCLLNSIDILDHVVVGTDKTVSMNEQGLLSAMKKRAFKVIQLPTDTKLIISASSQNFVTSTYDN